MLVLSFCDMLSLNHALLGGIFLLLNHIVAYLNAALDKSYS